MLLPAWITDPLLPYTPIPRDESTEPNFPLAALCVALDSLLVRVLNSKGSRSVAERVEARYSMSPVLITTLLEDRGRMGPMKPGVVEGGRGERPA